MATCFHCKTENTELHENGVPICLDCSASREAAAKEAPKQPRDIHTVLVERLCKATNRADAAARAFDASMNNHRLNGAEHIIGASEELSAARKGMMDAHTRLSDFLARGIVPEDLKLGQ